MALSKDLGKVAVKALTLNMTELGGCCAHHLFRPLIFVGLAECGRQFSEHLACPCLRLPDLGSWVALLLCCEVRPNS